MSGGSSAFSAFSSKVVLPFSSDGIFPDSSCMMALSFLTALRISTISAGFFLVWSSASAAASFSLALSRFSIALFILLILSFPSRSFFS